MSVLEKREKSLAEALAILVEEMPKAFLADSTRPIPSCEDEGLTLEVRIPSGVDRKKVMDGGIHHAIKDRGSVLGSRSRFGSGTCRIALGDPPLAPGGGLG